MTILLVFYIYASVYIAESDFKYKGILLGVMALGGLAMFEKTISLALFELQSGLGISPYQSVLQFVW